MKLKIVAVALLFLSNPAAFAQRGGGNPVPSIGLQIRGLVRLGRTNAPAENVFVRLEASIGGEIVDVQTDRSGKFLFSGLAGQEYEITVSAPGYIRASQRVDLKTDNAAFVQFQLMPDSRESVGKSDLNAGGVDARIPDAARKEFEKARSTLNDPKKAKETISHLEKAVSLSSNFPDAQLLLGTVYMDSQQWDKAESTLQQVLAKNPELPAALFALGEVYLHGQKYKDAEDRLTNGLRRDDSSLRGHLALGRVYFATGDLTKASSEVGRAIQLKPDMPEAHLLAGNIFFKARQADKALPFFEEYLKLEPNGPYAAETRDLVARIRKALGIPLR